MSGDGDIVFEDVKHREPRRKRRPDFDRHCACAAYHVPAPDDLPIFLDRKAADAIERHALRDTRVELGGVLLGWECIDEATGKPFVWITQSLEAKHYENTQASFTYTHDAWEAINRERDQTHPDLDIVGWYHTHPDFGIFLSGHDLFIHRRFFDLPLQVAYVVDPIRQTRGFFQWRDGDLHPLSGFYLSGDRGDRIALARLANDLENIPNADAPGGGISPRLEAELINMMSRPSYPPPQPQNSGPFALLFLILGLTAGILGYAGIAWVNGVSETLDQNSKALQRLKGERDLAVRVLGEADPKNVSKLLAEPNVTLQAAINKLEAERDDMNAKYQLDNKERLALLKSRDDFAKKHDEMKKERDEAKSVADNYKNLQKDYSSVLAENRTLQKKDDAPTGVYYRWYQGTKFVAIGLALVSGWLGWLLLQKQRDAYGESPYDDRRPGPPTPPASRPDASEAPIAIQ